MEVYNEPWGHYMVYTCQYRLCILADSYFGRTLFADAPLCIRVELDLLCQLWLQRVRAAWQVVGILLPLVNQGYPMIYFAEWGQLCHYSAQLILVFA